MSLFAGQAEKPLVLVEKAKGALRLVACDAHALQLGLSPGLMLADAQARVPNCTVAATDPDADQSFLMRLAEFCDRFTPMVALNTAQGLMLDITGCAHLFGGESRLHWLVSSHMARLGLALKASIASTPDAAHALARFGNCDICPSSEVEAAVRSLSVAALDLPQESAMALSRAGLKRLGDLADRPSVALTARFGEGLMVKLRRTLGWENARITPLRLLPRCVVEKYFPEPLRDIARLDDILTALVAEAMQILDSRGEGGRTFEVSFFRSDGAIRRIRVETGRPSRDVKSLLRLIQHKLDAVADPLDPGFGFDSIRFAVVLSEPFLAAQISLDGSRNLQDTTADLVDRLVARFGRDRVLSIEPLDSHHPSRAMRLRPVGRSNAAQTIDWPEPEEGEPPGRPLQLFSPPQPIETLAGVPDGPPLRFRWRRVLHEITRAEGPERIAPEWWRDGPDEPTRDYYRVEDTKGHRFWLFRAGLYERPADQPRWYVHGLFA